MAQLKVKQISDFVSAVTAVHNGAVGTDTTTAIAAAKSQAISQAVVNGDIAYDVKNAASTALVSAESKDVVRAATASTATATVASNLSTELVARADADTALQSQINALAGVNSEEEIATYVTAASFATVNTFDLNGGHVAVFVNGLQIHEAVAAGDGWKSGDGQNFTVQSLGYVLEAGDHIIVTGKIV